METLKGSKTENKEGSKFNLVRLYVKDASLEAPHVTDLVTRTLKIKEGDLTLEPQLNFRFKALKDHMFEVTAHLKLTAKSGEVLLYLIEIQQIGIFLISNPNLTEEAHMELLKQLAPSMVFPHLAEAVANFSYRTSLPPVDLTHILQISASPEVESKESQ